MFIAQALTALALVGLWMGTGLHFVSLVPALGPLVRMQEYMVSDVFDWLVLLTVAVLGFSAASFSMHKGYDHSPSGADDLDGCLELMRNKHESFFFNLRHLFRIALGGEVEMDFDCQEQGWLATQSVPEGVVDVPDDRYATGRYLLTAVSPLITALWLIWSVVLAMNMLIAYPPRGSEPGLSPPVPPSALLGIVGPMLGAAARSG
jgi:hypothetical protein